MMNLKLSQPVEANPMSFSIAVVIPAHNSGKTVEATIQSVMKQSNPPEEIIVVDDGSVA